MEPEKPTWVEYFMYLAFGASMRSKDPSTRVGCVIVDSQTLKILSIGYNGFPPGISNSAKNWEKERKRDLVVHAEANAVLLKGKANLENSIAFVTLCPCKECAHLLIQAGVRRVYYLSFRDAFLESAEIFKAAKRDLLPFKREVNDGTLKPFQESFNASFQAARDHVDTLLQTPGENVNTVLATAIEEINTSLQTAREHFNTWLQTPRENVNTLPQTPREHAKTLLQTASENVNTLLQTAIENVNSKETNTNEELYEWIKKEKEDLREKDIESPWVRDDQDEQGSDEFLLKKWTEFFLFLALVASTRSSKTDDKEGAILIEVETLKMCSLSYKGYPRDVEGTPKKEMMVSAITNALALRFCEGNKFYAFCTNFPEEKEVKNLAQANIERLYFLAPTNLSAKALSTLKDATVEVVPMDLLDQKRIKKEVEKTIQGLLDREERNEILITEWPNISSSNREYDLKPKCVSDVDF